MGVLSNTNPACAPMEECSNGGRINGIHTPQWSIWMSVRAMLTLGILREIHTKSVYFVLDYTQADVKSEIFMELPIGLGGEGDHPR